MTFCSGLFVPHPLAISSFRKDQHKENINFVLLFPLFCLFIFLSRLDFISVTHSDDRIQANSSITRPVNDETNSFRMKNNSTTNTFRDTNSGALLVAQQQHQPFHHFFFFCLIRYTRDIRLIDFCSFSASLQTLINTFYALFLSIQIQINILLSKDGMAKAI